MFNVVDWRSSNFNDSAPGLGGILLDSNLGRSVAACGGGKVALVCTQLNLRPVSVNVKDGLELCLIMES